MYSEENLPEIHDYLHNDLQFMFKSTARFEIMLNLLEGPKSIDGIKTESNISLPAIYNNLKSLMNEGFVKKAGDYYHLTSEATLSVVSALKFMNAMKVINGFEEAWVKHDISGIPDDLLEDIDWLINADLIKATALDIYKPQNTYRRLIRGSSEVYGVSPISQPDLIDIYEGFLKEGTPVELVLTDPIIRKMFLCANLGLLKTAIRNRNLKLRRFRSQLKVAFTVTDKFFSLGLFDANGVYDQNRDIMSTDKKAIEWGFRLYEYYHERSEDLGLINLTQIMLSI